jgi:hypothetical protein
MSPPKKYFLQRYYYLFFLVTICYQEDWWNYETYFKAWDKPKQNL